MSAGSAPVDYDTVAAQASGARAAVRIARFEGFANAAMIAAVSAAWLWWSTGSASAGALGALLLWPAACWTTGRAVTSMLGVASFFALEFLFGITVLGTVLTLWKLFSPWPLFPALLFVVAASAAVRRARGVPRESATAVDVAAVAISLAVATGWCQDILRPVDPAAGGVVFRPWSDFFWHSTMVARMLQGQSLLSVGSFEWQGLPALPYHYATYVFPALLAELGGVAAYDTVTAFWAPMGSFVMALAAYALGRALWGPGAGLTALLISQLPDAAMLRVGHPLYGYFWLQHVAPAGMYGVAVAALGLILVVQGARHDRRAWTIAGVVVSFLTILFKTHVFAAAFPLAVAYALATWPAPLRRRIVAFGACAASALAIVAAARIAGIGPTIRLDGSGAAWHWPILAAIAARDPVLSWYAVFAEEPLFPWNLPRAVALLTVSVLGLSALLAPGAFALAWWRKRLEAEDWIPFLAIAIFIATAFGLNRDRYWSSGDEILHRPFVWATFVVTALSAGRLAALLRPRSSGVPLWAVRLLAAFAISIPFVVGTDLQRGIDSPWAQRYVNLFVDEGWLACARFIRASDPVDATVQDSRMDGEFLIFGALSERRSYAARPWFWERTSRSFRASDHEEILARLDRLKNAATVAELRRAAEDTRIDWYVTRPGDSLPWPRDILERPAFESGGYKVFDLRAVRGG